MENDKNPEERLIELVADSVADGEAFLEGLGSGALSLEDVELWRSRRVQAERAFLHESALLIEAMKREGFGSQMNAGEGRDARLSQRSTRRQKKARRFRKAELRPAAGPVDGRVFTLALRDLGLPCSLVLRGGYEELVETGAWHAAKVHHLQGDAESVRGAVRSALSEELSPTEFIPASPRRRETQVSDESANMTH